MRQLQIAILFCILTVAGISCRKDFEYVESNGNLEFSRDTVFLDTIFSNIGSSTYSLKVYNRSKEDVSIPEISLAQGNMSSYRLNVDGVAGKVFTDISLLAKDSLFIFIETTFDVSETNVNEFLYTDVLQFDKGDKLQQVPLITLVKDAVFLFPPNNSEGIKETVPIALDDSGEEIQTVSFELTDEQLRFTNEKPYVIYGYAVVPEEKILIIDAGARVHFHKDSGVLVKSKASITISGELSQNQDLLENEVVFEGDRLEPEFENISGQWGGIWISSGSIENTIDHLTLKNAVVGLFVEGDGILASPTLSIQNTQIYNSSNSNLWGKTARIRGENLVLGSSGNSSLYCNLGGNYNFVHSTIANYWTSSFRTNAALAIDNIELDSSRNETGFDLTQASFTNCIIDGNGVNELLLRKNESGNFNYSFTNCSLTFDNDNGQFDDDPLYNFEDESVFTEIILNQEIGFQNVSKNEFNLNATSPVIGKGNKDAGLTVPVDILGTDRTIEPDIGAYEWIAEQ